MRSRRFSRKSRLRTHENIGSGPIRLPEEELHTSCYWFTFDEAMRQDVRPNDMQHALLGIANVLVASGAAVFDVRSDGYSRRSAGESGA